MTIKTIEEARAQTYGSAYLPQKYQEGLCCETVYPNEHGRRPHQCTRKNGHGPGGLYCKQHDPDARKARQDARSAKWDAKGREEDRQRKMQALAIQIADKAVDVFCQRASMEDLSVLVGKYEAMKGGVKNDAG